MPRNRAASDDFDGSQVIETATMVLFWQPPAVFGQWTESVFVVDGVTYVCAEQFMMAEKARLFGDEATRARILAAASPREHKALGRKVRNFDDAVWKANRERIVMAGSRAKFTQNAALRDALLATAGTELVEASPFDRIWGVGLSMDNPAIEDPANWRGKNLLGRILTRLRDELLSEHEARGRS